LAVFGRGEIQFLKHRDCRESMDHQSS